MHQKPVVLSFNTCMLPLQNEMPHRKLLLFGHTVKVQSATNYGKGLGEWGQQ